MTNKRLYNNPKFTTKRGNVFYVNFRLPSGVFFRQSLGTDSLKIAEVTMSRLMPYIPLVQHGAMSEEAFKMEIAGVKKASKKDIEHFLADWLRMNAIEAKTIPEVGKLSKQMWPGSTINTDKSLEQAKAYAQETMAQLHSGDQQFAQLIRINLNYDNLQIIPEIEPDIEHASSELTMAQAMLYQAYEAFYRGDFLKYKQLTETLCEQAEEMQKKGKKYIPILPFAFGQKPFEETAQSEAKVEGLLLKDAIEMYCEEKGGNWRISISRDNNRYLELLLAVLGNVPVNGITKQNMREVWAVLKSMPKRTLPQYSKMTLKELLSLEDIPEEDCQSSANIGKHWKIYSSLFKVFLKNEKDILAIAPTEGIKLVFTEKRYGNYTNSEMKMLVQHAQTQSDDDPYKWVFLLLAYTGARRGEIVSLKHDQIRKDEGTGRYYLMIANDGGKTEAAKRQVPLSKQLISLGFLDYIKGKTGELFPVYARNPERLTINFKNVRDSLGIPEFNDYGDKRVVHSTRHSCTTEMAAKIGNTVLVQQVIGHKHSKLGITERYTHRFQLTELLPVIDSLDWL